MAIEFKPENEEQEEQIDFQPVDFEPEAKEPQELGGFMGFTEKVGAIGTSLLGGIGADIGKFLRLPGETIAQVGIPGVMPGLAGASKPLDEARTGAFQTSMRLIKRARTLPDDDPNKWILLQQAEETRKTVESTGEVSERLLGLQVSPREAIGRTLTVGGELAPLAFPPTAGYLGAAGQLGGAVGTTVVGNKLQEGKNLREALTESALPAATGALVGVGGHFLGNMLTRLTKSVPEKLYQSALKQSTQDFKKELARQAPNLTKQLTELGVHGNDGKILGQSLTALNRAERTLQQIVKQEGDVLIDTTAIANSLDDVITRYKNVLGDEGATAIQQVKRTITEKGKFLSLGEALRYKRDIYEVLSNSSFNIDASLSQKSEALRVAANSVMKEMAKVSPAIKEINAVEQMWIRTAQAVEGNLARTGKHNIVGLSDAILAGAGFVNPSAVLAGVGRRIFETTGIKTGLAVGLDRVGKAIQALPTDEFGKISKTAIVNLLGKFGL